MKIKYVIAIFCVFALIVGSLGVYAWQTKETNIEEKDIIILTSTDGIFTAGIGNEKNKDSKYILNGNYQKQDKIITCDGTVINGENQGEFTGIFKEDKKSYFEITIIIEEEKFVFIGSFKIEKNKDDFYGEWCNHEMEKCFDFVYPISYIMPDGTIITGESEKEIWQLIKAWYEENPDEKEKHELQYPVDLKYSDGTIVTIYNDEELKNAYENCDSDKEWGWIIGIFQGMKDEDKEKNLLYIYERYPMFKKLLEIPIFQKILNKF